MMIIPDSVFEYAIYSDDDEALEGLDTVKAALHERRALTLEDFRIDPDVALRIKFSVEGFIIQDGLIGIRSDAPEDVKVQWMDIWRMMKANPLAAF